MTLRHHRPHERDFGGNDLRGPRQRELFGVESPADELFLHDGLDALDESRRWLASFLHGIQVLDTKRVVAQRAERAPQQGRGGDGVLDSVVDTDAACGGHDVGSVSDDEETRFVPSWAGGSIPRTESVHRSTLRIVRRRDRRARGRAPQSTLETRRGPPSRTSRTVPFVIM